VAQLKALFPEVFTEGKVDFDALRQLLGDHIDDQAERYGLNWHGKGRARQLAQQPSSGTLRPVQSESVHWDTTQNLFIEGDNLEVLKLLQKSYHRKVKMIYIDPPYNTGKEFIYPDKYQDNLNTYLQYTGQVDGDGLRLTANAETGGRYHTNWLNMMYPRLKLARNLLRDDGVIFVSIDDHEVHNLRHLMDEVFGPENFITQFVWQKKYTRANDAQFASDNHDHIICFSRNYGTTSFNLLSRTADQIKAYTNPDNHPLGPWKSTPLHAKSGSNAGGYLFSNGVYWEPPPGTYRRFSDERMALLESENAIWFGTNGDATPSRKSFLTETKDGLTPVTIWPHDEVGHNHEANDELKKLLGGGVFSNPKPTRLVRRMLTLTTSQRVMTLSSTSSLDRAPLATR
jgi:adenine-specific DNA-methyltransferase